MAHLSEDQMRAKLLSVIREAGSQKAWAIAHGISPSYVNDCLNRGKPIGGTIAIALGYRPATVYLPISKHPQLETFYERRRPRPLPASLPPDAGRR